MKWIQQFTDRQCRGGGRRAGFFLYKSILGGAASLGQDIQKCVCVRESSLVPLDSAELSFVLGTAVGFCLSPFYLRSLFF